PHPVHQRPYPPRIHPCPRSRSRSSRRTHILLISQTVNSSASLSQQQIPERRKGQQQAERQKNERCKINFAHGDNLRPPSSRQHKPYGQPHQNAQRTHTRKRPRRPIEREQPSHPLRSIADQSQHPNRKAPNTGAQNRSSPRTIGQFPVRPPQS